MKHKKLLLATAFFLGCVCTTFAQRSEQTLEKGWKFTKGDIENAQTVGFNDDKWEEVTVPHDWAIYGPFDRNNDLQNVAVTQNFETQASVKTGRTGGLPYVGVGGYRTTFNSEPGKQTTLVFDGAMSEARVYVNGKEACFWPLGYNSFHCNVTSLLNGNGKDNVLAVRLENRPQSSRWYPGAGLYRNVHVITTGKIHVPVWGTQLTTPHVAEDYASVCLKTSIENAEGMELTVITDIISPEGKTVATKKNKGYINHGQPFTQNFIVEKPKLWSPESPALYRAVSKIYKGETLLDSYATRFGIRSIEFIADKGFYLNGKHRKFQGVCNHHDLGPLGAAINVSALRHQLVMLKDMGCDAIRTSHNMPAPELVELCDEMGFMMMIEPFDEWDIAKCENGYHRYFNEWAEKDMINMLHHYRNNPCVVMWSIGNEVPTQCSPEGYKVAKFLQDICHREDPTRPVTCGMDQVSCVLDNGFAAMIDIPGFNYRAHRYQEAYNRLPQNLVLGAYTNFRLSNNIQPYTTTTSQRDTTWNIVHGAMSRMKTSPWQTTIPGPSANLYGQDSTIWASLLPMIPMPGLATVHFSESSIWQVCPKTATIFTAVFGIKNRPPCMSCLTGTGMEEKEKIRLYLYTPAILKLNSSSMEKATANSTNSPVRKARLCREKIHSGCNVGTA